MSKPPLNNKKRPQPGTVAIVCTEKEALSLLRSTTRTVSYAGITRIRFEGYLRPPLRFPAATTPTVAQFEYTSRGAESQEKG
jgi:hypothetical protein